MNKVLYVFCLFTSICVGCSGQKVSKNQSKYGNEIIDPVEYLPFEIKRRTHITSLPDSLGGGKVTGLSILHLFINKTAIVDSFKIVKLGTISLSV